MRPINLISTEVGRTQPLILDYTLRPVFDVSAGAVVSGTATWEIEGTTDNPFEPNPTWEVIPQTAGTSGHENYHFTSSYKAIRFNVLSISEGGYVHFYMVQSGITTNPTEPVDVDNLRILYDSFYSDMAASNAVNYERYTFYLNNTPFSGGVVPPQVFQDDYSKGVRCVRNFGEVFDPFNDWGFILEVAALTTGSTIQHDEVSIGDMRSWDPQVGDPISLRWDGANDTISVGGINVSRGTVYYVSSVGVFDQSRFVRIRPGGIKSSNQSVPITNGRGLYCKWKNFPNDRANKWYQSIQNALNAGLWVIATPFGRNLWDFATIQAGESFWQYRTRFGWPGLHLLTESWVEHIVANITDPFNRLILSWQNEDVAAGATNAIKEAASKPVREYALSRMRAKAPNKLLSVGGAAWSSPESLAQIVPTSDTGVIYECHQYSDASPSSVWSAAVSWMNANNKKFFVSEHDRLTDEPESAARRTHLISHRDYLRGLGVPSPCYWAKGYQTGRRLADTAFNIMTFLQNILPVLVETPVLDVAPVISGTTEVGQTLTLTTPPTWFGKAPISVQYQWQLNSIDIEGENGTTYLIRTGDVFGKIRLKVTATNSLGSNVAYTEETEEITGAAQPPVNTQIPIITGTPQVGQTLSGSDGTWIGDPLIVYTYQWQRGTTDIPGATNNTYLVDAADEGLTLRLEVTGTNGVGSSVAFSASTPTVQPLPSGDTQQSTIVWAAYSSALALTGGPADNNLIYNLGLVDWRGDNDALTTTAGGLVSTATSGQGITGTAFSNGNAANQGTHSLAGNYLELLATGAADTNCDFYAVPVIRDRFIANGMARCIIYGLVISIGARPAWDTTIMRVGVNDISHSRQWARGYGLQWLGNSGTWRIYREGSTASTYKQADINGMLGDEYIAFAWVLNDSRSSGVVDGPAGAISRIFIKTKPSGSKPTMAVNQTSGTEAQPVSASNLLADLGRSRWHNFNQFAGAANNFRIYALGADGNPPITDTDIENNLNKLLARV